MDPKDDTLLPPQYVVSEIKQRVARGPVAWQLVFQLAQEGDAIDDLTRLWPESRPQVVAGRARDRPPARGPGLVEGWFFDPDAHAARHRAVRRPAAALPLGGLLGVAPAAARRQAGDRAGVVRRSRRSSAGAARSVCSTTQ